MASWDDRESVSERGYCVYYHGDEQELTLDSLKPADYRSVSSFGMWGVHCPKGTVLLHTHPPDGPHDWNCQASTLDHEVLDAWGTPVALVQCTKEAIVPYFPDSVQPNRTESQ